MRSDGGSAGASAARAPTYAGLIARAFTRWPDRVAIVAGDRTVSYAEQLATTVRMQRALLAAGVCRGDGVGLLARHSPEAFFTAAAALCLGCRYVPINPFYSTDDQLHVVEDAGVSTLVFDPTAFEDAAGEIAARSASLQRTLSLGPSALAPDLLDEPAGSGSLKLTADPDDIAVVFYTGGSTGRPKGVALSQRTLAMSVLAMLADWEWPAEIRLLSISQLSQGLILPAGLRGGSVVLHEGFDPEAIADAVARQRVTTTFLVPPMLYALLDYLPESARLDGLETAIYGNAPTSPARLGEAVARFGPIFMQEYSLSEATPACILRREEHLDERLLSSCGRPIGGVEVELRDESGCVDPGTVGEVHLRGMTVMSGYWGQPALSAEALDGGWLRTGDLAYEDDRGFLHLVDRKKDMVVTGGMNVYSREVEDALCGVDGVAATAVFGVPDDVEGEAVRAAVVARPGAQLEVSALQAAVERAKGSRAVPRAIEFVPALPLTPLGKPDKRTLRAPFWSGAERAIH